MATRVTEADLLEALATAARGSAPDDAKTVMEMAGEVGMTEKTVRRALQRIKSAGRLTIHSVFREGLDGRNCRVAAYTILPATTGKG